MADKDDYKAMHDDAMAIMDVARRMSGFSANHMVDDDEEDEESEKSEVSRGLRKKMMVFKLKKMTK